MLNCVGHEKKGARSNKTFHQEAKINKRVNMQMCSNANYLLNLKKVIWYLSGCLTKVKPTTTCPQCKTHVSELNFHQVVVQI